MADLVGAGNVVQGAQEQANQAGHTVGDAMQAYHIAATAEHARQSLDLQKQEADLNKAKWLTGQVDQIGRMSGPAQQIALKGMKSQIQQVVPGYNPENLDVLIKDPSQLQGFHAAMSNYGAGKDLTADDWGTIQAHISSAPTDFIKMNEDARQTKLNMMGMQAKNAGMVDVRQQALDLQGHAKAVGAITDDKQLQGLQTTYQNLNNAITTFKQGGATPQEFSELQQAVRANLGIKGQSGVGERAESYLKDAGLEKSKLIQFLSGDPQSIMENDSKFANQILGVADLELKNKRSQADQQIQTKTAPWKTFYQRQGREGLHEDFQNTIQQTRSKFDLDNPENAAAVQQIQKNAKTPQAAAPSQGDNPPYGPSIKQGGSIYNWNPQTKSYK